MLFTVVLLICGAIVWLRRHTDLPWEFYFPTVARATSKPTIPKNDYGLDGNFVGLASFVIRGSAAMSDSHTNINDYLSIHRVVNDSVPEVIIGDRNNNFIAENPVKPTSPVLVFENTTRVIRWTSFWITCAITPLILVYGVLKIFYGTHTYDYAYVISGISNIVND